MFLAGACATPTLGTESTLPERPASLRAAFDSMPSQAVARVRILDDNVDAWVARYNAIESATRTIDVQYFILDPDAYGLALLGQLAEKARLGVKVRLMVDARGAFGTIRSGQRYLLQEAQRAGVDVRVYNPMLFQAADMIARGDLRTVVSSNHDKLVIVDERLAIAGGRNLSQDYLSDPRDRPHAYVDMDALYEDESVARNLVHAFEGEFFASKTTKLLVEAPGDGRTALELALKAMRLWLRDVPFSPAQLEAMANPTATANVAVALEGEIVKAQPTIPPAEVRETLKIVTTTLASQPRLRGALARAVPPMDNDEVPVSLLDTHSTEGEKPKNTITDNLLRAFMAAEREIVLQSPYFVLTPVALQALAEAAARGVTITVLTNSPASSDSPPTQAAFLKQWPTFLARVPTARLFVVAEARLMHSKVSIIDGVMSFVGSYNLDPLSAYVNGEVVGVIWGESQAQRLHHAIDRIITAGPQRAVEYTIARDADGRPALAQGEPVVTFGPDNHCTAAQLAAVRRYNGMLNLLAPIL